MDEEEYAGNQAAQEEELNALVAIYGDDCSVWIPERRLQVYLPSQAAVPHVVLRALLPPAYPSKLPPQVDIEARHLEDGLKDWMMQQLYAQFEPGSVILFQIAEWIKDQDVLFQVEEEVSSENDEERRDVSREHGSSSTQVCNTASKIITGPAFVEKKSTFQAHVSTVHSVEDVERVMSALLSNSKIRNATHNIMAYRIRCPERNTFLQDQDDDGECAAGGRLLRLLQFTDAQDVVIVVSRWYGGVKLGPARFTHINNAARDLLVAQGYICSGEDAKGGSKRKT